MLLENYILAIKVFVRGKICYKKYLKFGIKNPGFIMNIISIGASITTVFIFSGSTKFLILNSSKWLIKPLIILTVTLNTISDTMDDNFKLYSPFI